MSDAANKRNFESWRDLSGTKNVCRILFKNHIPDGYALEDTLFWLPLPDGVALGLHQTVSGLPISYKLAGRTVHWRTYSCRHEEREVDWPFQSTYSHFLNKMNSHLLGFFTYDRITNGVLDYEVEPLMFIEGQYSIPKNIHFVNNPYVALDSWETSKDYPTLIWSQNMAKGSLIYGSGPTMETRKVDGLSVVRAHDPMQLPLSVNKKVQVHEELEKIFYIWLVKMRTSLGRSVPEPVNSIGGSCVTLVKLKPKCLTIPSAQGRKEEYTPKFSRPDDYDFVSDTIGSTDRKGMGMLNYIFEK